MEIDNTAQVIEALVHRYSKLVFHMIYGMTGQWQESQDLTQDFVEEEIFVSNDL